VLTTRHPLSVKVGTNFADKRRSLGRYSTLCGLKPRSLFLFVYQITRCHFPKYPLMLDDRSGNLRIQQLCRVHMSRISSRHYSFEAAKLWSESARHHYINSSGSTGFESLFPRVLSIVSESIQANTAIVLWRVMPLKTPIRLLIGLFTIFTFVTTITHNYFLRCVTFTQLTILTRQYSTIFSRSLHNALDIFTYSHFPCLFLIENSLVELTYKTDL
jgi:hypothetical protein